MGYHEIKSRNEKTVTKVLIITYKWNITYGITSTILYTSKTNKEKI